MTGHRTFIAMFRALDCLNDEKPNDKLQEFLSDANVYLFRDRNAAVKDIQDEFVKYFNKNAYNEVVSIDDAYKVVATYLYQNYSFGKIFTEISLEEWEMLCGIINDECDAEGIV